MYFRYVLLALLFVGLYRFIVRIVLPVFRVTTKVRAQMRHMRQANSNATEPFAAPARAEKKGDYIEFEELR